jgi:quercetin dioxygenase-like cupin family protein
MRLTLCAVALIFVIAPAVCAAAGDAASQPVPGLAQKVLQRFDVPGTNYETVLLRVEFPPGYDVPRHSHPGPQASYVLFGDMTYLFDGEPPAKRIAGESKDLPGYAIHGGKAGPRGAILLNTYVVEKGKPLSIAAPD